MWAYDREMDLVFPGNWYFPWGEAGIWFISGKGVEWSWERTLQAKRMTCKYPVAEGSMASKGGWEKVCVAGAQGSIEGAIEEFKAEKDKNRFRFMARSF